MKRFGKLSTWFLVVFLTLGIGFSAYAADSTIVYKGIKQGFEFVPGSTYVETDLFDEFKQVMPGDVRTEKITIVNRSSSCDYISVYIGVIFHDETNNPISPKVLAELTEDERRGMQSELEYMHDFLEQLTLTVWNGDKDAENKIYSGSPYSLDDGLAREKMFLGNIPYGRDTELNVQLEVNIEMGNEYADRIGEVDWVFIVEERYSPSDNDDEPTKVPTREPETEASKTETGKTDTIDDSRLLGKEDEEGFLLNFLPMTGDNTVIWPYVLLMIVSLIGIIVLIGNRRKEDKE